VSAVVLALGMVSNPEMKRSEMAWIAWHTTSVTCSTNIMSLEFFGYFLFQDKKYRGFGVQPQIINNTIHLKHLMLY
jgi:hypothetical protein